MPKPGERDLKRERSWRRTIRSWEGSGETILSFCEAKGLKPSAFHYWRRELRRRDGEAASAPRSKPSAPRGRSRRANGSRGPGQAAARFVPLTGTGTVSSPSGLIELERRGTTIRVGSDVDGGPGSCAPGRGASVMLSWPNSTRVFLCVEPADMRRSFDGLAHMTTEVIGQDPLAGHLFVFRNRRGDRLKILWWDSDGYVLWYKRLEQGTFRFPPTIDGRVEIDRATLSMILEGIDTSRVRRRERFSLNTGACS